MNKHMFVISDEVIFQAGGVEIRQTMSCEQNSPIEAMSAACQAAHRSKLIAGLNQGHALRWMQQRTPPDEVVTGTPPALVGKNEAAGRRGMSVSFEVSKIGLFDAIKKLAPFVYDGADKNYLRITGIFFEAAADAQKIRLVATNGHIMGINDIDIATPPQADVAFSIAPEFLVRVRQALRDAYGHCVMCTHDGQVARFACGEIEITVPIVDADFPEYRKVYPEQAKSITHGLNARYIRTILNALGSAPAVIERGENPHGPHMVSAPNMPGEKYIIMPMIWRESENEAAEGGG